MWQRVKEFVCGYDLHKCEPSAYFVVKDSQGNMIAEGYGVDWEWDSKYGWVEYV